MIALALLRFLQRTPWSTALALIGMALGVTSIVSVHLVSANVSTRLDGLVPESLAPYSHYLHRDRLTASDYFELRREWRAGQYPAIQQIAPLVDETITLEQRSVRVLGTDLLASPPTSQGDSSNDNTPNSNTGSQQFSWNGVWVDPSLQGQLSLPVNGIIQAPRGTLLADIGTAHDLLGWSQEQLSYLGLVLQDPFATAKDTAEKLLPGFGAGFPTAKPELKLPTGWQLVSTAEQYPAREFGKSILFNISALGMLALLVAWLLIYQVAVSWLRRLWPVFERLHVLGVEWQQLRLYFLFSIGLLAAFSAVLGLIAGWWLANWLMAAAVPGEASDLLLDGWVVLKALGSALTISLLGGIWAFQRSAAEAGNRSFSLFITAPLLMVAAWCVTQPVTGLAGGFFAIAVLSLAGSLLVAPLLSRLRRLASMVGGSYLLRIGIREALWHPRELSVSIAGLSLAIATSIGVALMVDSFRADFSQMLDHRLKYDVVAQGDDRLLQQLIDIADELKTADRMQVYRQADIRVQGLLTTIGASEMDRFEAARYSFDRSLAPAEVLLSEQAGQALGLQVGDLLEVNNTTQTVAGIFSAFGDLQPRIIVSNDNAITTLYLSEFALESIAFASNQPGELVSELRILFPELELRLQSEIRQVALDTFDQTFAITRVLITIALLVAAISIYIAAVTMRLNRRTGRQLLTTLGATRREQLLMNLAMGSGLGLLAIIIALPLGTLFGWILCDVINPRAFGWTIDLQLSPKALLVSCGWGMLAAIAAGLLQGGGREEGGFGAR